jgi:hypothetical protein
MPKNKNTNSANGSVPKSRKRGKESNSASFSSLDSNLVARSVKNRLPKSATNNATSAMKNNGVNMIDDAQRRS